jgi:PAS domain S-box-containing protein
VGKKEELAVASVLVLDDRQDERDLLATVLGHVGHRVLEAGTAGKALELARAERPDLIITDILMPTMDGYDFVRQLRADPSIGHTRVIFCTANYVEEEVRELAAVCGVSRLLLKPCEPETLIKTVGEVVDTPIPEWSPGARVNGKFDREHLRVLNNKLVQKISELEAANQDLERTTAALSTSEARLQAIIDNTEAVIVVKAADDYRYLLANNAVARTLGVGPDELIGKRDEEILPPALFEQVRANDRRVLETGKPLRAEERMPGFDGDRTFISLKFPLPGDDGRPYAVAGVCMDITQNKRVEQELRALSADLERSNTDLEQFAYAASHDLSEPLRAVSGMVQLLAKRYAGRLDADADEYMTRAVDAAKRMQVLIEGLLEYARVGWGEGARDPVDCSSLVAGIVEDLRQRIKETGTAISVDPLPTVRGEATQLRQVFQNLISNALKFGNASNPTIHVGAVRAPAEWRFSVTDNGIGIDPRYAKRVFEVFKRLNGRDAYLGSGIGLSICKRIVERHGGEIWVGRAEGGGSRFQFTIPDKEQMAGDDSAG